MKWIYNLALIAIIAMAVSACVTPVTPAPAAPAATTQAQATPAAAEATQAEPTPGPAGQFTVPNPKLSDIRVRRALAYCIDRDALIASVYPYVADDIKPTLRMDSFLPKSHWAYKGPYTDYPYDPAKGGQLLDDAGWKMPASGQYRQDAKGDTLSFQLTTTNAQFRQTWAAVVQQDLAKCGIQLSLQFTPASWWFGDTTGLARRDFELGAYAWVGQADPSGQTLYACNQIPLPTNNWQGQNYMGWCNKDASDAIVRANNTLARADRIKAYDIVQKNFAEDMVSLPLFQRAEAEAWSLNLDGLKLDPTEYGTASAAQWKLKDGGDTAVLGFAQEPSSLWSLVTDAAVAAEVAQMGIGIGNTQYNYDFQPVLQDGLSTIESGLAKNATVKVKAGDTVYNASGKPEKLAKGTEVLVNGEKVAYDGTSELELPQLTVTYKLKPYTWSDGVAGSIDDVKLAYKINCDKDSGATSFIPCDEQAKVDFGTSDPIQWTVTFWPGVQDPTYFNMPWSISPNNPIYPSHQVLSDGRKLSDVPAKEWATLPEISQKPLSYGPFMVTDWQKGQQLTLEANPYYNGTTGVKKIVIVFISDTNQAVAQLLNGDVDYLDRATLGGGPEVQTLVDAAKQGKVNVKIIPSPTWEHIDMNLYLK